MTNTEAQIVMSVAGYYTGGIDGIAGPKTRAAIAKVFNGKSPMMWGANRMLIAAVQTCLNSLGFEAGEVDGLEGHNTREALNACLYSIANGGATEMIKRVSLKPTLSEFGDKERLPSQSELALFYGDPETQVPQRIVKIKPAYRMVLDWDKHVTVKTISVHKSAAPSLEHALENVVSEYGQDNINRLGLNRYAGCYNKRRMRGGSSWSTHAYGCAIDFFAEPNGLRTRCPDALFCGNEYKPFLDIMERHGWLPAIRLWGADAMHFQRATL